MTTNYVITGVWFKENKKGSEHISHVMLHEYNSGIATGSKKDKNTIVELLKTKIVHTIKWDYKDGSWKWGAKVSYETRNGIHYLRTVADGDTSNNLDNLINMEVLPL